MLAHSITFTHLLLYSKNLPDFRQNKMRCYDMNMVKTIDASIAIYLLFALQSYEIFLRLSRLDFSISIDSVLLTLLKQGSFGYTK